MYQNVQTHCDQCAGKGSIISKPCATCGQKKLTRSSSELTVTIERGMKDAQIITLEREGDQHPDHTAGDVVFTLVQALHPVFERTGDDLRMRVVIGLEDALLGFTRRVDGLDGEILLSRQGVTQNGRICETWIMVGFVEKIRGGGFPLHGYSSERGSLYVEYAVVIPESVDYAGRKGKLLVAVDNPADLVKELFKRRSDEL